MNWMHQQRAYRTKALFFIVTLFLAYSAKGIEQVAEMPALREFPLHFAATAEVASLLVENGADKEVQDADGLTSLLRASEQGRADVVELLLKKGANKHARDNFDWTALHNADTAKVAELLLENGLDKESLTKDLVTPLHAAAYKGRAAVVKLLLDRGANIQVRDERSNTPLHYAVRFCNVEMVNCLLAHGADRSAKDKDGFTPLVGEKSRE